MKTAAIWSTTTPLLQHMWKRGKGRSGGNGRNSRRISERERKERERQTHETIGIREESDKHNIMRFCYKLQLGRHTGPA